MTLPTLALSQPNQFLAQPNIVLIFWGDPTTPLSGQFWLENPDFMQAGTTFFIEFMRGFNVDRLGQYGVGIGNICAVVSLIQDLPTDGFQGMTAAAVSNGNLPQPDEFPNMAYV